MEMNSKLKLLDFLKTNILTTSEAAEMLGVTRQRLNAIVKSGELSPIKQTQNVSLFLASDVDSYARNKKLGIQRKIKSSAPLLFDNSGVTRNSIDFFEQNINKLRNIVKIHAFFEDIDAAVYGFFVPSEHFRSGNLLSVNTPGLVLIDEIGQELWLGGCNCGYGGEGPHGTERVLKKLGFSQEDIDHVFSNHIVTMVRENDKTDVFTHDRSKYHFWGLDEGQLMLYYHDDHLALIHEKFPYNYDDDLELKIIERSRSFIPKPVQITIFNSDDQAREHGYSYKGLRDYSDKGYRVIIKDESDRELWLDPIFNHKKPILKQEQVKAIIEACGFEIPKSTVAEIVFQWIDQGFNSNKQVDPLRITQRSPVTIY